MSNPSNVLSAYAAGDRSDAGGQYPDDDRLYDGNFWLALISQTCFVIANTLMAHYSRWIDYLGGDLTQIGSIMGFGAFLGLLLRPWMAQWINRLGARGMWAIGYVVFSVSSLANLSLGEIGPAIYLFRSGLFLGAAIVFASGLTYISQTSPDHRRTEAIGVFGIGGFMGMLVGPFLGDLFLFERAWGNFAVVFVVAALANLLPAIGLFFMRPTDSEGTGSSVRLSEFVTVVYRYWPGTILLVDLTFGVCMSAPFIFVASFIDQAGLQIEGVSEIGLFFFIYAGFGIAVRLSSRRLPDRVGSRKVLVVGMLFMTVGMFCFSLVDRAHSWAIVVPAVLAGTGHGLMFHTMTSLTLETFPKEVRGTGSALALMMLDLGTIAGAPLLGWVGQRFGFAWLFAVIGTLCLGTAITFSLANLRLALDELRRVRPKCPAR